MKMYKSKLDQLTDAKGADGCVEFSGWAYGHEYGQVSIDKKTHYAHRVSYEMHIGEIPDGMVVMHKCDNTKCFNPDHLMLGTQRENIHDMQNKGRRPRTYSKITAEIAAEIRRLLSSGVFQNDIAKMFGIAQTTISQIKRNKTWAS